MNRISLLFFLGAIIMLSGCMNKSASELSDDTLAAEFVEYGKYSDLRNSEPEEYEYDTEILGTNIIKRYDYYEFNAQDPETGQTVYVYTTKETESLMSAQDLTVESNQIKSIIEGFCYTKLDQNSISFADLNLDGKKEICVRVNAGGGDGYTSYGFAHF